MPKSAKTDYLEPCLDESKWLTFMDMKIIFKPFQKFHAYQLSKLIFEIFENSPLRLVVYEILMLFPEISMIFLYQYGSLVK